MRSPPKNRIYLKFIFRLEISIDLTGSFRFFVVVELFYLVPSSLSSFSSSLFCVLTYLILHTLQHQRCLLRSLAKVEGIFRQARRTVCDVYIPCVMPSLHPVSPSSAFTRTVLLARLTWMMSAHINLCVCVCAAARVTCVTSDAGG